MKLKHLLLLACLPFTMFSGALTSKAQAAETFSVQEGKALNTNWNFRRIDGTPRISIWQRNDGDRDQQFDRLGGNLGGTLLKHVSTGLCLNAHYLWNGAEINLWNCNGNDPDQNFDLVDVGNNFNLIRRRGTNLCVDTPTRNDAGKVHLWQCDANNGNQRWRSSNNITPPPPSGYFRNIESTLNGFFNSIGQAAWSNKSLDEKWDRISGESAQFGRFESFTAGDLWQVNMPSDPLKVYEDLSTAIFGSPRTVTSGYLYDQGYFNGFRKWHSGLDIGVSQGTQVKTVVGGTTWLIQNQVGNYFMTVKGDDGKLWIYGHLGSLAISSGRRIEAGQVVGNVGSAAHLHLEVQNNPNKYEGTQGAHPNQQFIRDVSLSPLQAYWQLRNR